MKSLPVILFGLLVLVGASCQEINDLLTFRIHHSQTVTIPASQILPGVQFISLPVTVTSNSEEAFRNNKTQANLVKDVTLEKIILTVQDPADEDFSFLRDIAVFIDAEEADEVKVAYAAGIPNNTGKTLELTSTNAKLDKYIKAESFTLRSQVTTDETLTRDLTIRMDLTFKVTADPIQ